MLELRSGPNPQRNPGQGMSPAEFSPPPSQATRRQSRRLNAVASEPVHSSLSF